MVDERNHIEDEIQSPSKIVRGCSNLSQDADYKSSETVRDSIAGLCIASDVLRTAEERLLQNGMLSAPSHSGFNPFWFLVETEKNVFLWRSGCSVLEKEDYDFWVDVEGLIEKRIKQLDRQAADPNPFSGTWGGEPSFSPTEAEKRYLQDLASVLLPLLKHLSALSEVQREIVREFSGEDSKRVVLPMQKPKR